MRTKLALASALVLGALTLAFMPVFAHGQDPGGKWVCDGKKCVWVPTPATATYKWHDAQGGCELHLRHGTRLVGTYVKADKLYYSWSERGGNWAMHASEPPVNLPPGFWLANPTGKVGDLAEPKKTETAVGSLPTGVISKQLHDAPRYSFKGVKIAPTKGHELVEGKRDPGTLTDDSAKDRLTVIAADPQKRARFIEQFKTDVAYADFRGNVLPWEAAPTGDWSVDPSFVKRDGEVYLEKADGTVIARAEVPDVTDAQRVVGDLRKANPDYNPARDPGGNGGAGPLSELERLFDFSKGPTLLQLAILAVIAFLVFRYLKNRP